MAALDTMEPDPDLEDNADDEPSLGGHPTTFEQIDAEQDTDDGEPWLGAPEIGTTPGMYYGGNMQGPAFSPVLFTSSQSRWADGNLLAGKMTAPTIRRARP